MLVVSWVTPVIALPISDTPYYYVAENYLPTPPNRLVFDPCSCVSFAKAITDHIGETWGVAGQIEPNTSKPGVGTLVLLNEGKYGHVAVIERVDGEMIEIVESNYIPCRTSKRKLNINDPRIRGYRNP